MSTRPLRVATDPGSGDDHFLASLVAPAVWAAGRPRTLVAPVVWAAGRPRTSTFQREVLGSWAVDGIRRVELASLAEADVAVLPFTLGAVDEHPPLWEVAQRAALRAERAGRLLLVFCHGDRYVPSPGRRCVVLRTALDARAAAPHDVALPAWVADPADVARPAPRPYRERPSVSFTGYAHPLGLDGPLAPRAASWARFAVRSAATAAGVEDLLHVPPADATRVAAITALRRSGRVDVAVRLRSAMTWLDADPSSGAELRAEMLADIAAADYGLAVRGFGNYSYRLYEVLASARRPLYVDTHAVLPRANAVDWDRLCVRVQARRLGTVGRFLADQHRALDPCTWTRLQDECRAAWVNHLSAAAFLGHLVDVLVRMTDAVGPGGLEAAAVAAELR